MNPGKPVMKTVSSKLMWESWSQNLHFGNLNFRSQILISNLKSEISSLAFAITIRLLASIISDYPTTSVTRPKENAHLRQFALRRRPMFSDLIDDEAIHGDESFSAGKAARQTALSSSLRGHRLKTTMKLRSISTNDRLPLIRQRKRIHFRAGSIVFRVVTTKAIAYCLEAIRVDETLGNPYNDIGSYLLAKGDTYAACAGSSEPCCAAL